jgi:hypothetical protein
MKKFFIFAIFSLCSLFLAPCSNAQGNLQFNRVINYSLKANIVITSSTFRDTVMFCVPPNKVWKIESAGLPNLQSASLYLSSSDAINYGTTNPFRTMELYNFTNTTSSISIANFPVWLASNFCGQFTYNALQENASGFISIIEFNVVP